ncbi:MAG: SDR family NAD(P)-dependent oxidoreductase [Gammaproteobacteria bacterium]|nr:SDR family NAD(P)-dependent oxidoreductase [Gammaproteobacteria bacterium]
MQLQSFGPAVNVAIVGASGGIGSALCRQLSNDAAVARVHALSRDPRPGSNSNIVAAKIDIIDETSVKEAAARVTAAGELDLVIVATGTLHRDALMPEKSMQQLDADHLLDVYRVNTVGPALVAKHFLPQLARGRKTVFAALSARVGSISDNRLGGWFAYRASKAALNMVVKTLAIEHSRRWPDSVIAALHPGTVDTALSRPFSARVPEEKLFSPDNAATKLLQVIDDLDADDSGSFFAWDGSHIPW